MTTKSFNIFYSKTKKLFNELIRQDEWLLENPVARVRKLNFDEKEMRHLTKDEITTLLAQVDKSRNSSLSKVVRICLRTGARWSEANYLSASDINIERDRAWIVYEGTKSGRVRRVTIDVEFARYIRGDNVGRSYLFESCISAFG